MRRLTLLRLVLAVTLLPAPARGVAWSFSDIPEQIVAEVIDDTLKNAKGGLDLTKTENWNQIAAYGDKLAKGDIPGILNDAFGNLVSAETYATKFIELVAPEALGPISLLQQANAAAIAGTEWWLGQAEQSRYEDFQRTVLTLPTPEQTVSAYNQYMEDKCALLGVRYSRQDIVDAPMKAAYDTRLAELRKRERSSEEAASAKSVAETALKTRRNAAARQALAICQALERAGIAPDGAAVRRYLNEDGFRAEVDRKAKEYKPPPEKLTPDRKVTYEADRQIEALPRTYEAVVPLPDYAVILSAARQAGEEVVHNQIPAESYRAVIQSARAAGERLGTQSLAHLASNEKQYASRKSDFEAAARHFQEDLAGVEKSVQDLAQGVAKSLKEIEADRAAVQRPDEWYKKVLEPALSAKPDPPAWVGQPNRLESWAAAQKPPKAAGDLSIAQLRTFRESILQGIQAALEKAAAIDSARQKAQAYLKEYREKLMKAQSDCTAILDKSASLADLAALKRSDFKAEWDAAVELDEILVNGALAGRRTDDLNERRWASAAQSADVRDRITANEAAIRVVETAIAREAPLTNLPSSSFHPGGRLDKALADGLYEAVTQRFQPIVESAGWLGGLGDRPDGNPVMAVSVYGSEQAKQNLANYKKRLPTMQKTLKEHRALLAQGRTALGEWEALKIGDREESLEKSEKTLGEEIEKTGADPFTPDYLARLDAYKQAHRPAVELLRGLRSHSYAGDMASTLDRYEKRIAELESYEKEAIAYFSGLRVPPPPDYEGMAGRYAPVSSNLPNLPFNSAALDSVYKSWTERFAAWRPAVKPPTPQEPAREDQGIKPEDRPKITRLRIAGRSWADLDGVLELSPEDMVNGQIEVTGGLGGRSGILTAWRMPDGSHRDGVTQLEVNVDRSGWHELPLYQGGTVELPWKYHFTPKQGDTTLAFRLINLGFITSDPEDCPPLKIRYSAVGRQDQAKETLSAMMRYLEDKNLNAFMRTISPDYYGGDDALRDQVQEFLRSLISLQIRLTPEGSQVQKNQVILNARWEVRGAATSGQAVSRSGQTAYLFDKATGKLTQAKGDVLWIAAAGASGPAGGGGAAAGPPLPHGQARIKEHLSNYGQGAGFDFSSGQVVNAGPDEDMTWDRREDETPHEAIIAHNGMIDLGSKDLDAVTAAPEAGYLAGFERIRLTEGHTYALLTRTRKYALVNVTSVTDTLMSFDWKLQPDGTPRFW